MKNKIIIILVVSVMALTVNKATAQIYRAAATDALQNNGIEWIERKLPPSVITFSDYSGQVEIKVPIASLFEQNPDSAVIVQTPSDTLADFIMTLDKQQIQQQQLSNGKSFTTSGNLIINNINKKATAQCVLMPRNNPADGFSISVVIRFNPEDYGLQGTGQTDNTSLIVRVTSNYLNKLHNNY